MRAISSPPRLLDTVDVLLPDRPTTDFLKTCLGIEAEKNWQLWRAEEPDLRAVLSGGKPAYKRLLPLLYYSLNQNGVAAADDDLVLLRLAALWEDRRAAKINALLSDVLSAFKAASVPVVVSNGIALATLRYPRPSLRHCHDIDLIVSADRLEDAAEALSRLDFTVDRPRGSRRAALMLVHRDGLPVSLHAGLPLALGTVVAASDLMKRADTAELGDFTVRVLDSADAFIFMAFQLVAGQSRDRTSWVVDTMFLLGDPPLSADGWRILMDRAKSSGLAIPVLAMLSYLRFEFDLQVPDQVVRCLRDQAGRETADVRDNLLVLMWRNQSINFAGMLRASGWRSKLDLMRWLFIPSPAYLRAWSKEKGLPWSPAWYVGRPIRQILLRLSTRLGLRRAAAGGSRFK